MAFPFVDTFLNETDLKRCFDELWSWVPTDLKDVGGVQCIVKPPPSVASASTYAVDYFSDRIRMKSKRSDAKESPFQVWEALPEAEKANRLLLGGSFARKSLYGVSQCGLFHASVAKTVYALTGAKRVLDPCMGWGCRLVGALTTPSVQEYYGCDPNPNVFECYMKMLGVLGANKVYSEGPTFYLWKTYLTLQNKGFEALVDSPSLQVDLAFTSPPYYDKEVYYTSDPSTQSIQNYSTEEEWVKGWLCGILVRGMLRHVKDGGLLALHVPENYYPSLQTSLKSLKQLPPIGILSRGKETKVKLVYVWRKET